ncbi:hypothetical protein JYK22_37510, partial [Nonomuraea sp. RK-328]|nr:hypothetical protein [Nonomuraea sp. RK-328]
MPTARADLAAAAVGTTIYAFGGERSGDTGPVVFAETEAYDTVHDRWRRLAPMPVPRHGTAAVAVGCAIHLPGGGGTGVGNQSDVNDAYRHKQTHRPHCGRT